MNVSQKQMDVLLDEIQGYVNGCPDAAMRSTIAIVMREYAHETGGIETVMSFRKEDATDGHYHLDAPYGGRIAGVVAVFAGSELVNPQAYCVMRSANGCDAIAFRNGYGRTSFTVVCEWEPTIFTREMPPDWFRANAEAVCHGVVAKLLTQEGKPWADMSVGAQFMSRYQEDVRSALYARHAARMEGGRMDMLDRNEPFAYGL